MKILKTSGAILLSLTLLISGCKPKDADIKASIEEKLKTNQQTAPTMVMVDDAVVTLSGEVATPNAKMESEKIASDAKGVKSVVNNMTVTPPPPPVTPPVMAGDDMLKQSVMDATKDHPTVKAEVVDGVIMLTGEIKKDALPKLMMALNSLNAKKIDNKLTVK